MSAGYDAEVADLFRDLRAASNMTEADLAARIATPVEVVQALEQGAIYALPPWPETCRVVSAYGTLLNLDTRPLLRRIYAQLEAGVVELAPKPVQDVPVMVPPTGAPQAPHGQPTAQPAPQAPGLANGTPQPQAMPQQATPQQVAPQAAPQQAPAWPNAQPAAPQAPQPQAPQPAQPQPLQAPAPQPVAAQQGQPQAQQPLQPQPAPPQPAPQPQGGAQPAWPGAAPQAPQGAPSPLDIEWPGAAPAGQPQQPQPAAPQPQPAAPQPQADASFPDASFPDSPVPADPQPYPQQPGLAPDPNAGVLDPALAGAQMPAGDASFPGEAELELVEEIEEDEPKKSSKSPLLKWGIIGLLAVVLLLGLWMVLGGTSGDGSLSSGFSTSDPVLDPDDPRSRKADRLPNNF